MFFDRMLKAGLISCWNKKQNMKSYLPANKRSGSDLNPSSHTPICLVKTVALMDIV